MHRITGLVAHPRTPGRYTIAVDGDRRAVVSVETVAKLGLAEGRELSPDDLAGLDVAAAETSMEDRAIRLLAARAYGSRELRRRLLRPGVDPAGVDAIMARLAAQGLVDDAAFARQFARSKLSRSGASRRFVLAALATRGVDRRVAESAVDEVFADEGADEGTLAERAARKRVRALRALAPDVRRRRLQAWLSRRGFAGDAIRQALASLDEEEPPSER